MAEKDIQEQIQPAAESRLTSKPVRRAGSRKGHLFSSLLFLLGGLIIVGGVITLAALLFPHSSTSQNAGGPPAGKAARPPSGCTGARLPNNIVIQETANGLHLTVAQVEAQVHAGKTIDQVAAAQGISQQQLRKIEIHALQVANQQWLSQGCLTQQEVNDNMRRDTGTDAYMNEEFTDRFKMP